MVERVMREQMDNSVTIIDPGTTWIERGVQIGEDTVIEPFTYIGRNVKIGCACRTGSQVYLCERTMVEDECCVGPRAEFYKEKRRIN